MRYGWSFTRSDWDELLAIVKGSHWRFVPFSQLEASSVPQKPGVYVICTGVPIRGEGSGMQLLRRLYNAVYVGQAESLRGRFLQHRKGPKSELVEAINCYGESLQFWFAELVVGNLDQAELRLIDCLGPQGNRVRGIRFRGVLREPRPA